MYFQIFLARVFPHVGDYTLNRLLLLRRPLFVRGCTREHACRSNKTIVR